jgi:hypothetical protein
MRNLPPRRPRDLSLKPLPRLPLVWVILVVGIALKSQGTLWLLPTLPRLPSAPAVAQRRSWT